MPRLPTLDDEHLRTAASRLLFLENFADRAGELVGSFGSASDAALAAHATFTDAAALALATDNTQGGKALLERVRSGPKVGQPSFLRQFTATAVVKPEAVSLSSEGIRTGESHEAITRPWSAPAPVMEASAGTILAVALACRRSPDHFEVLSPPAIPDDAGRLAQLAIATSAEAATLPLFGMKLDDHGFLDGTKVTEHDQTAAFASFLALHDRYAAVIRLNRADTSRWKQLRCRAPLIDWPLLLLHLALQRHMHDYSIVETRTDLAGRLAIFLRNLASDIDGDSLDGNRGGPGGGAGPRYGIEFERFRTQTQDPYPNLRSGIAGAD